jgi:nucleoside-diphosphate-sugar epimerase
MGDKSKVLVAGASGLVGQAAARHFSSRPGWDVVAVSRRRPSLPPTAEWICLDLGDSAGCDEALSAQRDVTHVVYAAVHEAPGLSPGWLDEEVIQRNDSMLRNLMEPLAAVSHLRHISLMQGSKAYGMHHPSVGWAGVSNPLRERDPRVAHPNFYFRQEDYLRGGQEDGRWGLTIFRPTVIYGDAHGTNMNPIPVLGAWAALLRSEGRPLDFPGRRLSKVAREAVDADLVARALVWAAESPETAGGTFNLTNGDVFVWANAWRVMADAAGMEVGEHRPTLLAEELPERAGQWAALVDRFGLAAPRDIVDFVGYNSMVYTDGLLSGNDPEVAPVLNSTIAARLAGFSDCMDSEDMFRKWFRRLEADRMIPPPGA